MICSTSIGVFSPLGVNFPGWHEAHN